MPKLLFAAAALLAALPAGAQTGPGPDTARQVALELRENGQLVASSSVRLQLGRPAAIAVNGPYSLRLRVDPAADAAGYTVRPNLHTEGPAGWVRLATQPISVPHGSSGRAMVERPSGAPLEIAVTVN